MTVVGIHADDTLAGNYLISTEAWEQHFTDSLDQFVFATTVEGVSDDAASEAMDQAATAFPQATSRTARSSWPRRRPRSTRSSSRSTRCSCWLW